MDDLEKRIIKILQGDLPLVPEPFKYIAERLNVAEEDVFEVLQKLLSEGKLSRIGVVLYHRRSGFKYNAMVCAKVEEGKIDDVAKEISKNKNVTHCYERETPPDWDYNLFFMFHGRDRTKVEEGIRNLLSRLKEVKKYKILFSEREFKKTSVEYV